MNRVYLDHNASSPMPSRVRAALLQAFETLHGNASSAHAEGQSARHALESARERVAAGLGVRPSEIVFTSGATESNNAALRGAVRAWRGRGEKRPPAIVTTVVEHPSIVETARALEREGVEVRWLPVGADGVADPGDLRRALSHSPAALVSVMHSNNETGILQPVEEMASIASQAGVPFHTDLAQSAGKIDLRPVIDSCGLASLASHKFGGPAGVGALVVRLGAPHAPFVTGGAQEGRRRAGTEAVPLTVAFAEAFAAAEPDREDWTERARALRDFIETAAASIDPKVVIHGRAAARLPNTTSLFFPDSPGRVLVMQMDLLGFSISTGSACSTGSARPSHVLMAMGCPRAEALDSIRISLGPTTTREEIAAFLDALSRSVLMSSHDRADRTLQRITR